MQTKFSNSQIRSRAQEDLKPATVAGFRFLKAYGDKMQTRIKYTHYTPAQIHDKGKKWYVWYSFLSPTGKMKRIKVYENLNRVKDLKEKREHAELLRKAVDYMLEKGFNPFKTPDLKPVKYWSLLQGINYYKQKIPDLGLRKKTTDSYYSFVEIFSKGFHGIANNSIEEINRNHCFNTLSSLKSERKWGNSTYNNALSFGRMLFSFFNQNGICNHNPFKEIKPLPETKTQNQPFTNEDWETIQKKADPDLKRFILFLYHTGTRPNEARQLKHEHILRERKLLYVPGELSKGKKDGYVPLSERFLELYPQGKGVIFGTVKNHFTLKFTALKRKLKLRDDYTLYSTKHTRVVHMAEDGVSPYELMQFLRHTSLEVTMNYLRGLGLLVGREAADKVR